MAFPKLGYIGIKKIMDKYKINYSRKTIVQALHLQTQMKSLGIKEDRHTIFSLDIEAISHVWPGQESNSILFKLIGREREKEDQGVP